MGSIDAGDLAQALLMLTGLAGLLGQYLNWREHCQSAEKFARDELREDFERQHAELMELRRQKEEDAEEIARLKAQLAAFQCLNSKPAVKETETS